MLAIPDRPMFYAPDCLEANMEYKLTDGEAHHAIHVVRLREGDDLVVSNGVGNIWLAQVTKLGRKDLLYQTGAMLLSQTESPYSTTIACGALGNAGRMETMVEKLIEIGVSNILLYSSERTGKHKASTVRLEKVAVAALKQSRKAFLPSIKLLDFEELINTKANTRIAATCSINGLPHLTKISSTGSNLVVIGPEGDFTEQELQLFRDNDFQFCSLGTERLRSETAAIYALICENLKSPI